MPCRSALSPVALLSGLLLFLSGCDVFNGHEPGPAPEPTVSVYAEGLVAPVGIEVDDQGRLWVSEQGTGDGDSRLSVVTPGGQVDPFLTGLPSEIIRGDATGAWRSLLTSEGDLLILQGEGTNPLSMSLLSADPAGFSPGDPPRDTTDVEVVADVGAFSLGQQGYEQSNPYAMTVGPEGDLFIADAGANALLRRDAATGELSLFASFEDLENPTSVGPPMIDAVPTDVVFAEGRFFVSTLTGFPFPEGQARIYEIDLQGNVSVFERGFTALVDLALTRRGEGLLALQIAQFTPESGFLPQTGQLLRVQGSTVDTLVSDLNLSSGMHTGAPGEVFVSSLADGEILRVDLR